MNKLNGFHRLFLILLLLVILSLACSSSTSSTQQPPTQGSNQTDTTQAEETIPTEETGPTSVPSTPTPVPPTSTPEPTPVPPTSTPLPIGLSRSNPFSMSEVVSAPNWDVSVLEVVRGEPAWQAIQAANQFNEPPSEGMEYISIKLHVKSTYADSDEHSIGGADFALTGDQYIKYRGASVVEPDPSLDAQLFTGGETEGWISFQVKVGEGNLILIVDELLSFEDERFRFIALDENATLSVPEELKSIEPTELGTERTSPAPKDQIVITEDWEVSIVEVIRGEDAWTMVQEANQFNDPPDEGMEYIAVKVHVRNISTDDQSTSIDSFYFKTTGSASVLYDLPSVVDPEPALDANLYPGGEFEGWIIVQVAIGETNVILVFEPWLEFTDKNIRYISLD